MNNMNKKPMYDCIHRLYTFFKQYNILPDNVQIVVSRYNEDISHWFILKDYVIIYNKGDINTIPEDLRTIYNIIHIPNVGRESHTYLYHITQNYDNNGLKNITLFIQCDFNDHISEIFDLYKYFIYSNNSNSKISKMVIHLKNNNTCCNNMWGNMIHQQKYIDQIKAGDLILSKYNFGSWWVRYISNILPLKKDFRWGPCGIFSVSKPTILKKPKEYYMNILDSISYCKNPEEGHYCERSWYYIF